MKTRRRLFAPLFGFLLGFVLSKTGFADYHELHKMLVFADLRLLFTFAGALGLTILGLATLSRRCATPTRKVHPGTVLGALLFGIGWAVTGACPAVPLAQVGEGHLWAFSTLFGILAGSLLYERTHRRFLNWDRGQC